MFWRRLPLLLLGLLVSAKAQASDQLVAVAIRYLQIEGTSHSRIYLYDFDGHLIRRLTSGNTGQDILPVFSPDGSEIAFTRQLPAGDVIWAIAPSGGAAKKLAEPPAWYREIRQNAPRFILSSSAGERYNEQSTIHPEGSPQPTPAETPRPTRLSAPDGSVEMILDRTGDDTRDYDNAELGRLFRVRYLQTGEESLLGSWRDFGTMWDPLHLRGEENHFFLIEPPLRTAFFFRHLNSTDGDTVYALDFARKRVVQLSPNYAMPVPISGQPGFFSFTVERYRPLGDGKRTVNCSYLDLWNAQFEKTRFGRDVPAIFNGACLFRRGKLPLVIDQVEE